MVSGFANAGFLKYLVICGDAIVFSLLRYGILGSHCLAEALNARIASVIFSQVADIGIYFVFSALIELVGNILGKFAQFIRLEYVPPALSYSKLLLHKVDQPLMYQTTTHHTTTHLH